MRNLVLSALTKSLYQDNVACAYIYYGSKSKPKDQNNELIHAFYQQPFQLQEYLTHTVLPILAQGLKNTKYKATDVSFENQAPHPFISIMRRDHGEITNQDLNKLSQIIPKAIKPVSLVNPTNLFHKEKVANQESKSSHQHVNHNHQPKR